MLSNRLAEAEWLPTANMPLAAAALKSGSSSALCARLGDGHRRGLLSTSLQPPATTCRRTSEAEKEAEATSADNRRASIAPAADSEDGPPRSPQKTARGMLRDRPSLTGVVQQVIARTLVLKKMHKRQLDRSQSRFLKTARLIAMAHRWWHRHVRELTSRSELMKHVKEIEEGAFQQTVDELRRTMLFDPSEFKADKQQRLSLEAKRILSKDPEKRTDQETHYAMVALRSCRTISEYPVRMQRNIAQYGMLECYGPRRIVLKQGHSPKAFYYIFYGTVTIVVQNTEGAPAEFQCNLNQGDNFGELAIINQSRRQSTVLTATAVELISISSEAYEKIFLSGGAKRLTDPDHDEFIRSLDFLDGWPIEKLNENPQGFKFSYFPRGSVMVKDSNASPWIYVVKSGSVQVLKRLARTRPTLSSRTGRARTQRRPSPQAAFKAFMSNELDGYLRKNNVVLPPPITERTSAPLGGSGVAAASSLSTDLGAAGSDVSAFDGRLESVEQARCLSAPSASRQPPAERRPVERQAQIDDKNGRGAPASSAPPHGVRGQSSVVVAEQDKQGRRRTFIDDLDGGFESRAEQEEMNSETDPIFVRVQTLTKGSVFGLSHMILMDQPSFCLVSNGADCMLINKNFYREYCPQRLVRYLLRSLSPYSTDEEMQTNLLKKLNWDAVRQATILQAIK